MKQEKIILGNDDVKNEQIFKIVLTRDFDQTVDAFFQEARDLFPYDERHIMGGEIHIHGREKAKENKNDSPAKSCIQTNKSKRQR